MDLKNSGRQPPKRVSHNKRVIYAQKSEKNTGLLSNDASSVGLLRLFSRFHARNYLNSQQIEVFFSKHEKEG